MKKFVASILIIIASLTASSQTGTASTTTGDTSNIKLPKRVAKEVVKDIIKGDSLAIEYQYLKANYSLLDKNLSLKDSVISYKDQQIGILKDRDSNYVRMLQLKDQQIQTYSKAAQDVQDKLQKERKKNGIQSIFMGAAIIVLITLLVK